jgi:hypothetical protein
MGELIRVYLQACQIRELFLTSAPIHMMAVYRDIEKAEEDCRKCRACGLTKCPYDKPRLLPFVAEDSHDVD